MAALHNPLRPPCNMKVFSCHIKLSVHIFQTLSRLYDSSGELTSAMKDSLCKVMKF